MYKYHPDLLNMEVILELFSQEEIFSIVFGKNFKVGTEICSPFREDKHPGCYLEYYNDKLWFASIDLLKQEEFNLCELLNDCEGVELWSDIFGKCKLLNTKGDCSYKIEVEVIDKDKDEDGIECFTQDGKFYIGYPNAKCMLWPSESNRDWTTFKKPIKIKEGTPVMCLVGVNGSWILRKYNNAVTVYYNYIVPATEFDFTNFNSNKSKSII